MDIVDLEDSAVVTLSTAAAAASPMRREADLGLKVPKRGREEEAGDE